MIFNFLSGNAKMMIAILLASISLKLLLIPGYHSTDFEVHRNWLAITHSLPIKVWYFENTSEWTLDYPPIFAYFEYSLSLVAYYFDPEMLNIANLNYNSFNTVLFQKLSVSLTDFLFILTSFILSKELFQDSSKSSTCLLLTSFNIGLFIVDHIHFQYNGILMGLLILCIFLVTKHYDILLSISFSILVLSKHLFAPLGLIIGCYLVNRVYCAKTLSESISKVFKIGITILLTLCISLFPFTLTPNPIQQFIQMFSRLFPFGRGLVHAYWAPNIWAVYCFLDKVLQFVLGKLFKGSFTSMSSGFNSTAGLVGDFSFSVLPRITAPICLLLIATFIFPVGLLLFWFKTKKVFIRTLVFASLSSFMLGYHVHEKAIIIPLILQTFVSQETNLEKALFLILTLSTSVSLFPLIVGKFEWLIKVSMTILFFSVSWKYLKFSQSPENLKMAVYLLLILFSVLVLFTDFVHPFLFKISEDEMLLPFLPLMMTSVSCALVNILCWILSAFNLFLVVKAINS